MVFRYTGALTANRTVNLPSGVEKLGVFVDETTGGFSVLVQETGGGGAGVTLPKNRPVLLQHDGSGDVNDLSPVSNAGSKILLQFGKDQLTADGFLEIGGRALSSANIGQPMLRAGSITGVAARIDVSVEGGAGDIDFNVQVNGSTVFSDTITTSGTGQYSTNATQVGGVDAFVADDRIGVGVDFDTFTGTVDDIMVTVEIELNAF
jgi:hypothetical protein